MTAAIVVLPVCLMAGLLGGFVSSAPIGPINLWVMSNTLHGRVARLPAFLAGVILADVVYSVAAAWGYSRFLHAGWLAGITGFVAGAALVILGLVSLNSLRQQKEQKEGDSAEIKFVETRAGHLRGFLLGTFLCGANPAFLAFWIFVFSQLHGWFNILPQPLNLFLFVAGVAAGDSSWFTLLIWGTRRGQDAVHPGLLRSVRYVLAWGLVVAGILAAGHDLLAAMHAAP